MSSKFQLDRYLRPYVWGKKQHSLYYHKCYVTQKSRTFCGKTLGERDETWGEEHHQKMTTYPNPLMECLLCNRIPYK